MSPDDYYTDRRIKLQDEIPVEQWSDVRREYFCEGKTVEQIAHEHYTGTRVISRLIRTNEFFEDIGVRRKSTVVHDFKPCIKELLKSGRFNRNCSITTVTRKLFEELSLLGYCGKERSLRNYVKTLDWQEWIEESAKKLEAETLFVK